VKEEINEKIKRQTLVGTMQSALGSKRQASAAAKRKNKGIL